MRYHKIRISSYYIIRSKYNYVSVNPVTKSKSVINAITKHVYKSYNLVTISNLTKMIITNHFLEITLSKHTYIDIHVEIENIKLLLFSLHF